ncbi:MAG TPA: DUF1015 domain-containing protein [Nitrospirae bacterium]|nr:DUF1015 domain-containing protein [Nitrospirota bacterium]
MAEIIPFKGILYNPAKVDASKIMAPPYDIVAQDLKEELYQKSPHNVIRIDFGKDKDGDNDNENRYTRASKFLTQWHEEGILTQDPAPSFYCYEMSYEINGETLKTRGFLGAVKIEELGKGRIHPHEMTYSKPKSDRLNILRICNANTSPIWSLYSSTKKMASSILEDIAKEKPFIEADIGDNVAHRLWKISDSSLMEKIKEEMSDKDVFIADGHHRYETALAFQQEMKEKGLNKTGEEPFNYVLMFLSNMDDEGLSLLPTHRIVEIDSDIHPKDILGEHFEVQKISSEGNSGEETRREMFNMMQAKKHSFGMYLTNADTYYLLLFKGSIEDLDLPDCLKKLDVTVLHQFIFEKLLNIGHYEYEMAPDVAVERANKGSFEAVFFLNKTDIMDVKDVALAGHRMPPKSTYFYPKLLTGMVIYSF